MLGRWNTRGVGGRVARLILVAGVATGTVGEVVAGNQQGRRTQQGAAPSGPAGKGDRAADSGSGGGVAKGAAGNPARQADGAAKQTAPTRQDSAKPQRDSGAGGPRGDSALGDSTRGQDSGPRGDGGVGREGGREGGRPSRSGAGGPSAPTPATPKTPAATASGPTQSWPRPGNAPAPKSPTQPVNASGQGVPRLPEFVPGLPARQQSPAAAIKTPQAARDRGDASRERAEMAQRLKDRQARETERRNDNVNGKGIGNGGGGGQRDDRVVVNVGRGGSGRGDDRGRGGHEPAPVPAAGRGHGGGDGRDEHGGREHDRGHDRGHDGHGRGSCWNPDWWRDCDDWRPPRGGQVIWRPWSRPVWRPVAWRPTGWPSNAIWTYGPTWPTPLCVPTGRYTSSLILDSAFSAGGTMQSARFGTEWLEPERGQPEVLTSSTGVSTGVMALPPEARPAAVPAVVMSNREQVRQAIEQRTQLNGHYDVVPDFANAVSQTAGGSYAMAVQSLRRAASRNPDAIAGEQTRLALSVARDAAFAQRLRKALAVYENPARRSASPADAAFCVAALKGALGDHAGALAAARQSLELDADRISTRALLRAIEDAMVLAGEMD